MKKTNRFMPSVIFLFYIFLLLNALLFTSCRLPETKPVSVPSDRPILKAKDISATLSAPVPEVKPYAVLAFNSDRGAMLTSGALPVGAYAPRSEPKYEQYKVKLNADKVIKMPGPPGLLRVWIGIPKYDPKFPEETTTTFATIEARGAYAKVIPCAPAFKVNRDKSDCIKIDPTGSQVFFTLTPTMEGIFNVGADVSLYQSKDCSGSPIPKGTTTLKVQVVVDHTKKFCEVFWEKLLQFWDGLLVLLFAVILFLIRKKLKKWIGFGKDN